MDMKFCKHVLNLIRYYRINSDHYTYMRKNRDISPQTTISPIFGGLKKQIQPTLNISFLEYWRNWRLKFDEIVIIQGDYKILWLEFVKTRLICFNSPISAHTPCCGINMSGRKYHPKPSILRMVTPLMVSSLHGHYFQKTTSTVISHSKSGCLTIHIGNNI
jgi:hypothetical protein